MSMRILDSLNFRLIALITLAAAFVPAAAFLPFVAEASTVPRSPTEYSAPIPWQSPSASAGAPEGTRSQSAAMPRAERDAAVTELQVALHLMDVLRDIADSSATLTYLNELDRLSVWVDGRALDDVLPQVVLTLRASRAVLLDSVEELDSWMRLARVLDPGAQLTIPPRFIAPALEPSEQAVEFDIDSLRLASDLTEFFEAHA